jgi:hypothetical protein
MLIKALAQSLMIVPECNVQFAGDQMLQFSRADISVAVSIPSGLITPIIKDARTTRAFQRSRPKWQILPRVRRRASSNPQEYQGGTASLSNMGMMGIKQFERRHQPPAGDDHGHRRGREAALCGRRRSQIATVMTASFSVPAPAAMSRRSARRSLGLKTAIVEREHLGGICLNWGCIPTKALLRSAEVFHQMQHAKDYGLAAENISADLERSSSARAVAAKQLNKGVTHLMKKNKITVHMGHGQADRQGKLGHGEGRQEDRAFPPSTSSSRPARARANCRARARPTASASGPIATR